ncbi:hypothetical protein S7335_997 [Synechococcus sp. PCC 7335]|uniref:hypothetical protein n=1 Tax=Synechococcus sp. (strain ATCC 29403 / PCC 7335) TaxID=91464 RepID=UPI00017ED679|nr:hypothetical protein [Synechococcus sp. PCC 7335]EDX82695.1 hypothetical protein S7335_997 [Synechococcus sp. PCC 7335]
MQRLANGYVNSRFVQPRTEQDNTATLEAFRSRGNLFSILESEIIASLENPSLVSSLHGSLERLLFTIPDWVFFPKNDPYNPENIYAPSESLVIKKYADVFRAILRTIPSKTVRTILTHEVAENTLKKWLNEFGLVDNFEIITVSRDIRFTVWAEDAYCICNDLNDKEKYFVEPASFRRADDAYIADKVSVKTDIESTQVKLYFQGGNILIGDDFWMIGADYPSNSIDLGFIQQKEGESEREAVKRVYGEKLDKDRRLIVLGSRVPVPSTQTRPILIGEEMWTEVLFFGNGEGTVQPLFHIDMFISLAGRNENGKYRVLVADPKSAYELLDKPLPEGAMQPVFDDISRQLKQLGFEVIRNPMPMAYDDDDANKTRYWYFATSNNVLLQDSPKIVWIPTYAHGFWADFSVTDEKNKEIWESLGYEVRQLPDFHPFAANLGAAHCITKYLQRG